MPGEQAFGVCRRASRPRGLVRAHILLSPPARRGCQARSPLPASGTRSRAEHAQCGRECGPVPSAQVPRLRVLVAAGRRRRRSGLREESPPGRESWSREL